MYLLVFVIVIVVIASTFFVRILQYTQKKFFFCYIFISLTYENCGRKNKKKEKMNNKFGIAVCCKKMQSKRNVVNNKAV